MSVVFVSMNYSAYTNRIGHFDKIKRKSNLYGKPGFVERICTRRICVDLFLAISSPSSQSLWFICRTVFACHRNALILTRRFYEQLTAVKMETRMITSFIPLREIPLSFRVLIFLSHEVVQLVEALGYKPEGCGLDSRWCQWIFFIDIILPAAL